MKKTTLKWHLSEKEKPIEDNYYLATNDIDSVFTYQTMYYSTFYGKFNCGGDTDKYALYPKYWAEVVAEETTEKTEIPEKEKKIFEFIDRCYSGTTQQVLATVFIRTLFELDVINVEETDRFISYDVEKFNEYVKEIENCYLTQRTAQ